MNLMKIHSVIDLVLLSSDKYHKKTNKKSLNILNCVTYLKATERFDEPLL